MVYMGTLLLPLRKKNIFMIASKLSASLCIGDKAEGCSLTAMTEKNPRRLWRWTLQACTSVHLLQGSWQQPGKLTGAQRQHLLPGLRSFLKGSALCWTAQYVRGVIFQLWKSSSYICLYFWLFVSSQTTPACVTLGLPHCTMHGGSGWSCIANPIPVRELAWRKDDWISGQLGHFLTYSLGTKSSELSHYPSASSF